VWLRVRDNERGGKKTVFIEGVEFIRRFLCHVVPRGFKRVRHYGLLASAHKAKRLRQALALPQPSAAACEHAQDFRRRIHAAEAARCPHCGTGRWFTVRTLARDGGGVCLEPNLGMLLSARVACRGGAAMTAAARRQEFQDNTAGTAAWSRSSCALLVGLDGPMQCMPRRRVGGETQDPGMSPLAAPCQAGPGASHICDGRATTAALKLTLPLSAHGHHRAAFSSTRFVSRRSAAQPSVCVGAATEKRYSLGRTSQLRHLPVCR
jgi:hypothetical protein